MDAYQGFRLAPGAPAPVQQSQVSCGAACLLVARMMCDPQLARWVTTGTHETNAAKPDGRTAAQRFGELERRIMARTNAFAPYPGVVQTPWPRALGTPPWGARVELEHGAATRGTDYQVLLVRHRQAAGLADTYRTLVSRVCAGRPALLYVGNARLPRHVTMVFADESAGLLVYEPAQGSVEPLSRQALRARRLNLGGWNQPWFLVLPTGLRSLRVGRLARNRPELTRPQAMPGGTLVREESRGSGVLT